MAVEHDVCHTTGTSLMAIDDVAALRVLQHAQQAKQNTALDRIWQLQVRMWRWAKQGTQRQTMANLNQIAMPGQLQSAFDQCQTDEERVRLIGLNVNCHGKRWIEDHETQVSWLKERGYTLQQACEADREWTRDQYRRHGYKNVPDWLQQERQRDGQPHHNPVP